MAIPTLAQWQRGLQIAEQIEALKKELTGILGNHWITPVPDANSAPAQADGRTAKRSPATIAKMKAAQKKRWAKIKAPAVSKAPAMAPEKQKSKISAAGLANIRAAQKKRWAKIKAARK